jgi:hypothetical protein
VQKEIYEQPESVISTVRGRVNFDTHQIMLDTRLHAYHPNPAPLLTDGVHRVQDELSLVFGPV